MSKSHINGLIRIKSATVYALTGSKLCKNQCVKNEKIEAANCNVQLLVLKKLNGAKKNIDRSQMMIKDLNRKDTDYKVLNNHLKMSLVLLERARDALRDALVDINLNRLKLQESPCHN